MQLKLDLRFLAGLFAITIIVMLAIWQPWVTSNKRTITVTGTASARQAPDEFIYSPTYTATGDTSQAAVSKVSDIGNAVISKLKELGVTEAELRTDVSNNPYYPMPLGVESSKPEYSGSATTAYYAITATVHNKELAQKMLTYLVTTNTTYAVTPQSILSKEARKKLENDVRAKALVDARAKAVTTAESLGAKLGLVVSVSELSGGGPIYALDSTSASSPTLREQATTAPVLLTGEQDLDFSVQVVYQIR